MTPTIDRFVNEYRFLSNFWPWSGDVERDTAPSPSFFLDFGDVDENEYDDENPSSPVIVTRARPYSTLEHAYQAAKTDDMAWREKIRAAETPGRAKRLGRKAPMRPGWDQQKLRIMARLLDQKFPLFTPLGDKLLDTYPCELIEGNTHGDTFYGRCNGVGENHLGRLLMDRRAEMLRTLSQNSFRATRDEAHAQCSCFGCRCTKRYDQVVGEWRKRHNVKDEVSDGDV